MKRIKFIWLAFCVAKEVFVMLVTFGKKEIHFMVCEKYSIQIKLLTDEDRECLPIKWHKDAWKL